MDGLLERYVSVTMSRVSEKVFPLLLATAKTGKIKYWQVSAYEEDGLAWVAAEYWQDAAQHQVASRKVLGKNLGRSNETTALQQAISEAESDWKKQKDKGYHEEGETPNNDYCLPMLAHDYKKRGHNITWPCYGQPKLDGFRCLFHSKRGFWSRMGKPFDKAVNLSHLQFNTYDHVIDGELILPGGYSFEETCKAAKKQRPETALLEYHVFDIISPKPYLQRMGLLEGFRSYFPAQVKLVPTFKLESADQATSRLTELLEEGHEGLMLRNPYIGGYTSGQRSEHLQKFKTFVDAEYTIVNIIEGAGKEEGAAIFVCVTAEGKEFRVRPMGAYETRREQFQQRDQFVGKRLTVIYQNLTDDGLPRFPVGKCVREEWDNAAD